MERQCQDATVSSISSFSGVPLFNQRGRYEQNANALTSSHKTLTEQEMFGSRNSPPTICINETTTSQVHGGLADGIGRDLYTKLNASFSVIGKWQQEAYSVFSSINSSVTNESTIEDDSVQVNKSVYAAAAAAKLRTVDWLANNYNKPNASPLLSGPQSSFVGNLTSKTAHTFKEPFPVAAGKKKVIRKVKHWHFKQKDGQFLLTGRCVDHRLEMKTWTSRPLTHYKRITSHTLETNDHTRLIVLDKFYPTGTKVLLDHPDYIVSFFSQGLPLHWEDVLVAWLTYIKEGKPAQFVWPCFNSPELENQSYFSDSCDEESAFTSVSERRQIQAPTLQSEKSVAKETDIEQVYELPITSVGRVCHANNLSLPVDKSFCINKFISTKKAGDNRELQLVLDKLELPPGTQKVNLTTCGSIYSVSRFSTCSIQEQSLLGHLPLQVPNTVDCSTSINQPANHEVEGSTFTQRLEDSKTDKSRVASHKACQIRKLKHWVPYMTQDNDDKYELRLRGTLVDDDGAILEAVHKSQQIVDCLASGEIVTRDSCHYSLEGNLSAHKAKGIPRNLHSLFIPDTSVFVLSKWLRLKDSLDQSNAVKRRKEAAARSADESIEAVVRGAGMEAVVRGARMEAAARSAEESIEAVVRGAGMEAVVRGAGMEAVVRGARMEAAARSAEESIEAVVRGAGMEAVVRGAGMEAGVKPRRSRDADVDSCPQGVGGVVMRGSAAERSPLRCLRPLAATQVACKRSLRGRLLRPAVPYWITDFKSRGDENQYVEQKKYVSSGSEINQPGSDARGKSSSRETKSKKVCRNTRKRKINHQTMDDATAGVITTGRPDRTNNSLVNCKRTASPVLLRQSNGASKNSDTRNTKKMKPDENHKPSVVNRIDTDCSSHLNSKRKPAARKKKKQETKKAIFERQKALASVRPTKSQMNLFDQSDYDISDSEMLTCVESNEGEAVARVRTPKRLGTPVRDYCVDLWRNVSAPTPPVPDITGPPITDRDRMDIISYGIQRQLDMKNTKFAKPLTVLKPKNKGDAKRSDVDSQVKGIYKILTKTKLPTCNVLPTSRCSFDKMNDDVYSETDSRLELLFEASSNGDEESSNSDS